MSSKVHFAWNVERPRPRVPYIPVERACLQQMSKHYDQKVVTVEEWWPLEFCPIALPVHDLARYRAWKPVYQADGTMIGALLALK